MDQKSKGWQEDFARFFESPSRESLRDLLRGHVGELDNYDFKRQWCSFSKLARHILGFANLGGGCLFFGIEQQDEGSFDPIGLTDLVDKADVHKGIEKYVPAQLEYEVLDFSYEASEYKKLIGKRFQVLLVEDSPRYIPFVALDNGEGIRKNAIYARHGTSTEEAGYEELQRMINRRVETGYSSQEEFKLDKHLGELQALYSYISRYRGWKFAVGLSGMFPTNPKYPQEDLEDFVNRMIKEKKKIIESLVRKGSR
jgi:hypothetical protein